MNNWLVLKKYCDDGKCGWTAVYRRYIRLPFRYRLIFDDGKYIGWYRA